MLTYEEQMDLYTERQRSAAADIMRLSDLIAATGITDANELWNAKQLLHSTVFVKKDVESLADGPGLDEADEMVLGALSRLEAVVTNEIRMYERRASA